MPASPPSPADTPLALPQLLAWLQEDGLLDAAQAAAIVARAALQSAPALHPLCSIAHPALTLDTLCAWLARRSSLPYLRIDPLHIDFSQVADIMTAGYAARFNILPVESTPERIVIATAQPYALAWQAELGSVAPRTLRLVIANPLHIAEAIAQFFSLASSVKVAKLASTQDLALRQNVEQLVELGRNKASLDANDQHVARILDWLWE